MEPNEKKEKVHNKSPKVFIFTLSVCRIHFFFLSRRHPSIYGYLLETNENEILLPLFILCSVSKQHPVL